MGRIKAGTHEGACSRNTLPQYTPGSFCHVDTHGGACSCNTLLQQIKLLELAPSYLTSLIQWSKTRDQKIWFATTFFRMKSLVHTRELCPGSMLQEHVSGASSPMCTGLKTSLIQRSKTWEQTFCYTTTFFA